MMTPQTQAAEVKAAPVPSSLDDREMSELRRLNAELRALLSSFQPSAAPSRMDEVRAGLHNFDAVSPRQAVR